jgi:hypothetical protein
MPSSRQPEMSNDSDLKLRGYCFVPVNVPELPLLSVNVPLLSVVVLAVHLSVMLTSPTMTTIVILAPLIWEPADRGTVLPPEANVPVKVLLSWFSLRVLVSPSLSTILHVPATATGVGSSSLSHPTKHDMAMQHSTVIRINIERFHFMGHPPC